MALKRQLGLAALTFYGVGAILGAGIYSVLGVAAARAGDALWLSFAVSAAVAFVTALSYAELATTYPKAGAEYTYLREALPRLRGAAVVTGLLVALSGAATVATVALAFGGYLRTFVEVPAVVVAWGLVAAAAAVNLIGVKESAWVNAAFTLLEVGGLVLFVVVGAGAPRFGEAFTAAPGMGVAAAAGLVFFAYLGFENIANLAEEAKRPARDVPRAIVLSLVVATALYVLVAVAAVALLPAAELGRTDAPLADAARTRSSTIAGALGGVALFATANTALVALLVAARVVFGIARDGAAPRALAALLPRRETPWVATLVVAGVAAALVPFADVGVVASVSSFASLVAFAAVNVALVVLRRRDPDARRPFRVPGAVGGVPVLPVVGAASALAVATRLDVEALVGGGAALAAFAVLAAVLGRRAGA